MLDDLRKEIDIIDNNIVDLIAKRIEIVKKVGEFKKQKNIPVVDGNRFQKVLEKVSKKAEDKNISKEFIVKIYNLLHDYMCEIEKKIK